MHTRPTPPSQQAHATEARLIEALAQLTAAHSDTQAITDHARHESDPVGGCAICSAFDVLMEEGQAALEERSQAIDDLQQRYDTLQAAHTRLQEEYAVLKERHEALSTAYYTLALAQLEDADRDPPA